MEIRVNDRAWHGEIGYKISITLTEQEARSPFQETFEKMLEETKVRGYDLTRCRFEQILSPGTYIFQGPILDRDLMRCETAIVD